MALTQGLYKARFRTHIGASAGLMVLDRGKLRGGDITNALIGTYVQQAHQFVAEVKTFRHTSIQGVVSVFGEDELFMQLKGKVDGSILTFEGHVSSAPSFVIQADLCFVGEAGPVVSPNAGLGL